MTKTKNLKFCTCDFSYDKGRKLLSIVMLRKGRIFYKTTFKCENNRFVSKFIKNFDDKEAKEINSLEMENL